MRPTKSRRGDWFQTYSGRQFWPLDPRPDDICIEDIAHHLAGINRFGGATVVPYSVAQHSVHVSRLCPQHAFCALMHDATEAYLGDVIRPLKYQLGVYLEAEQRLWEVIAEKFCLPLEIPAEVKRADNIALMTERRDLLRSTGHDWGRLRDYPPDPGTIRPLGASSAKRLFLMRYTAFAP
ncbi:MAG TPA: phosphohydrolase [Verrucomicrobiae bacterium]|nr:phosphohydrolase [Verrucomicrobiae bacterium]